MKHDIKAPEVGESISEVSLLKWNYQNGDQVNNGDVLVEIESDKATVEVIAESDGSLEILKNEGDTVPIGEVIARIDDATQGNAKAKPSEKKEEKKSSSTPSPAPASENLDRSGPAARKVVAERGLDANKISGTGKDGRITKGDALNFEAPTPEKFSDKPGDRREKMPRIRQKIAERLVHAQRTAAILTTFNEVDMTEVMKVRNQYKEGFQKKHGVKLSFMSFFTKAVVETLKKHPDVNASIDGDEIIYHDYQNVGIAVGTEKGLVVPVLNNAEKMDFADIEKSLSGLAKKARDGKLSIAEMSGGTFTVSNGGTYGSLLSTPILNPPQSGILGMHNIVQRPIAVDGKVEIRPMMYLALSYDHRMIDGKGAVTFLVDLIELLHNPESLGLESLK